MESCRGIGLLNACYKLYSKVLNEKLKAQAEYQGSPCIVPLFGMKLLVEKRRYFNLETHSAFLDYVKGFD
jgi:hypothetical protein